jgi:hypothetical protein
MHLVLALLALAASPSLCAAQEGKPITTVPKMEETVKVTLMGEIELDYVWRRKEITAFTGGVSGTSSPGNSSSENTFEGFVALRMNADLSDSVSAVVELGTKRVDGGHINFFAAPNTAGTGSVALSLQLREANILFKEVVWPELSLKAGIIDWDFDVRGRGSSTAFDPRHAQRFVHALSPAADGPLTLRAHAHDPEELEPVGIWIRLARTIFTLDLVALPAVIEGGSANNDESFYAIDMFYKFDSKESRFGLIAAVTHDPGSRSMIFTYGGGVDWKGLSDGLDLTAEFYFQNGWNNGLAPGPAVQVGAYAFNAGAEYVFGSDLKPWVEFTFTYFSGDGDATPNGKASAFNSYENIHDLLILEDMYTGFDWDTNYRAFKIGGGARLHTRLKNDLKLRAIVGYATSVEPVRFPSCTTHKLGTEVDLTADWELTRQVTINAGVGFLFGSKILQQSMEPASDASRQTILFTLGTNLRF